jgi:hypothetical protein
MLDPAFERITKELHRSYDELLHEPLPERWIDLIKRLNAEENDRREGTHPERFKDLISAPTASS